jgi:lambda repressor-like predicted transcriptional regulator
VKTSLIQYLLDEKGATHESIAVAVGVSRTAVSSVIRSQCKSERIEREIARVLELPVQDVFPNRYDAVGALLPRRRKRRLGGYNPHTALRELQAAISQQTRNAA